MIGVHTPEFSFEHEIDRVRRAVKERGIDYPVAADNDYAIWTAFENHYWLALHYFVDTDGVIRDYHFGEGRYERSERTIQRLLGVEREPVPVEGVGVDAAADGDHLRTPENYLGYERTAQFALPVGAAFDKSRAYQLPQRLPLNQWARAASGRSGRRTSCSTRPAGASPSGSTPATRISCFPPRHGPLPFRVLLDGQAPGPSHGVDVDEDGNGSLLDGRMYQLVRQDGDVREQTLEITFLQPGAEAYSFTFG